MRWLLNLLFLSGLALSTCSALAGPNPKKEETPKNKKTKGKDAKAEKNDTLSLPIPKEHPQKGVKIPLYNPGGKLQMYFTIGTATWVNEDNINMQDLSIQTYKEDGAMELNMDFPEAVMNVRTKEISTDTHVDIRREDFEVSGNKMVFNTETKVGTLANGVRMLIYDISGSSKPAGESDKKLTIKTEPAPSKK